MTLPFLLRMSRKHVLVSHRSCYVVCFAGKTASGIVRAPLRVGRVPQNAETERTPLLDGASESGEELGAVGHSTLANADFSQELKSVLTGEEVAFLEETVDEPGD